MFQYIPGEGVADALGTLNQILGREWQDRQADKERGLKLTAMKIQSDERELDRLNEYVMTLEKDARDMETEFAKLTNIQTSLGKLEAESGGVRTDAQGLIEQNRTVLAADRKSLDERMIDAKSRREQVLSDLGQWSQVARSVAPEAYEEYRAADKEKGLVAEAIISPEEWSSLLKDRGIDPETREGKIATSALRSAFTALEAGRFGQLLEEDKQRLAWYKARTLDDYYKAQGAGAGLDFKQFTDRYRQYKSASEGLTTRLELDPDEGIFLPSVDRASSDIYGAMDASAHSIAKFMGDKLDWSKTSGYIKDMWSEYKDLMEEGKRQEATGAALALVRELGKPGQIGAELDLAGLFKTRDAEMAEYLTNSIEAINALQDFHGAKLMSAGINPVTDPTANYLLQGEGAPPPGGEGEGEDTGSSWFDEMMKGDTFGEGLYKYMFGK